MPEPGVVFLILLAIAAVFGVPVLSLIAILLLHGKLSRVEDKLSSLERQLKEFMQEKRLAPQASSSAEHARESKAPASAPAPAAVQEKSQEPKRSRPAQAEFIAPKPESVFSKSESVFAKPETVFSKVESVSASSLQERKAEAPREERKAERPQASSAAASAAPSAVPPGKPQGSSFERNAEETLKKIFRWIVAGEEREGVSLEYAVATTWLVRGAVVIILSAIAFGVNYSIKRGLLGPEARVAASFAAGFVMTLVGVLLCKGRYRPAGQGLVGGGIVALYFSSFASSMVYHLISSPLAFGLMALTTAACCVVAMSADSLLIALVGVLGGYATPLVLSTGVKNLPGLFIYMALLGVGLLFVSRKKDWPLLSALSMLFSYGIYFAALAKFYDKATDYPVCMAAGAAFFLIFALVPLLYKLANKTSATLLELILYAFNSLAFFSVAHALTIQLYAKEYASIASLSLAAWNVLFVWLLLRKKDCDKALTSMLLAFAAFFVAFSVPLLLGGEQVTAAWSLLALALLWLAGRLDARVLAFISYALYALAAFRLSVFDMESSFRALDVHKYWSALPCRLATFASFIGSLAGACLLLRAKLAKTPETNAAAESGEAKPMTLSALFLLAGVAFLVVYLHFELYSFGAALMPSFREPLTSAIWTLAALVALFAWLKSKSKLACNLAFLFALGLILKLFCVDVLRFGVAPDTLRFDGETAVDAVSRALDFLPAVAVLFAGMTLSKKGGERSNAKLFCGCAVVVLFAYLTMEVKTFGALLQPGLGAGAVSALWGFFALSLLLVGLRKNVSAFRISGLILFFATALKIFVLDLSELSQLARIGAFFALGAATLAGAFVYMRFRSAFERPEESASKEKQTK